jgi:hypothetical protein
MTSKNSASLAVNGKVSAAGLLHINPQEGLFLELSVPKIDPDLWRPKSFGLPKPFELKPTLNNVKM